MVRSALLLLLLLGAEPKLGIVQQSHASDVVGDGPNYTADGQLKMPERYREWVFLTSGLCS